MAVARRGHSRSHHQNRALHSRPDFEQFQADQKTVDAVIRNLEVIGEAVRQLRAHRDSLPSDVPWADIAGMRNVLIHAYFGVDLKIIWQTIAEDLAELRVQIQKLARLDED